jgi:hypothetical protein
MLSETHSYPNCHADIQGKFCYSCGQNQTPPDRLLLNIINEAFEGVFSANSRAARTLFNLLFKPGFLTVECFAGRRARYVQTQYILLTASYFSLFFLGLLVIVAWSVMSL